MKTCVHTKTYTRISSVESLSRVRLFETHGLQRARPPSPSPVPGVYSNSCLLNQWCHPAISSSITLFSSFPQSFPVSQLFTSGGPKYRSFSISPCFNLDFIYTYIYIFFFLLLLLLGFPGGLDGKESACNAGDPGSIPGPGRSFGVGNGSPFQYSCLENSIDRGAWWATVYEVENSRKLPIDFHFIFFLSYPREGTADRTYGLVENSLPSGHTNATYDY